MNAHKSVMNKIRVLIIILSVCLLTLAAYESNLVPRAFVHRYVPALAEWDRNLAQREGMAAIFASPAFPIHREGRALVMQGRSEEGLPKLQEAIRIDPELCVSHIMIGLVHQQHEDFDKAIRSFENAATAKKCNPTDQAIAHYDLGALYLNVLPDYPKAEYHFKKSLEINPHARHESMDASLGLAKTYQEVGDYDKMLTVAKDAYRRSPHDPQRFQFLAHTYLLSSHFDTFKSDICSTFEQRNDLQPEFIEYINDTCFRLSLWDS